MKNMNHDFLPVCREDMEKRGWKSVDFAYINQEDIVSELFLNRIGKIRKVFVFTENRDWDFLFLPEIWIRW